MPATPAASAPAPNGPSKPGPCTHLRINSSHYHTIPRGEGAGEGVCSACYVLWANYQIAVGRPF